VPARSHYLDEDELREVLRKTGVLDESGELTRLPDGRAASLCRVRAAIDDALRAFGSVVAREAMQAEWLEASGASPEERERRSAIERHRLANARLKREREWREESERRAKEGKPPISRRGRPERDKRGTPEDRLVGALAGVMATELGLGLGLGRKVEWRIDRQDRKPHPYRRLQLTTSVSFVTTEAKGRPSGPNVRFVCAIRDALLRKIDSGWRWPGVETSTERWSDISEKFTKTVSQQLSKLTPQAIQVSLRQPRQPRKPKKKE